jgi:uncharacterized protein YbbC (DUF1343 family)
MSDVFCGVDVLARERFARLAGQNLGLITNHTGLTREGVATADLLHAASNVRLKALFGPEHGIRGALDERVPDGRDEKTNLPVFSLYGDRTEPTPEQLIGLDTLVFDIQDIGCRFYTYLSTLGHCLEVAARHQLKFVVLDRPNPINGVTIEGPIADSDKLSFVAYHPIPLRHAMTLGELAWLIVRDKNLAVDLTMIACENWKRTDWWDATGLVWTNPSPNMRSLNAATLYPGVGVLEFTNLSVGRGTDTPFEVLGAPFIDARTFAASLNAALLPGVRFVPIQFTPNASKFAKERCGGVNLILTDRQKFASIRTGLTIAQTLHKLYPNQWQPEKLATLLVHKTTQTALLTGTEPKLLERRWQTDLKAFLERRKHVLIY